MNDIIWKPSDNYIKKSNIFRFMQKNNIRDYQKLIERSKDDIEWFWERVIDDLKLDFFTPYKKVLDATKGIQWAKWFTEGKINIAYNCVDRHAKSKPHKTAIIWEGEDGAVRTITYLDLFKQSNKLANALKRLGIKKGDCIGLFMPMVPEAIVAVMACCKIGAIYNPIFSGYAAQAVAARLSDCDAKLILTCDGFLRRGNRIEMKQVADEAVKLCPSVKHVIVYERLAHAERGFAGGSKWNRLLEVETDSFETEKTDSEDPFMIIYTSGTTGRPKGSVHVHGGFLVKIMEEVAYQTDMHEDEILFWVTDMGWIMAPWEIVGALALGGTILIFEGAIDYPTPDRLWSMVERHRVNILGISPTAIRSLMKFPVDLVKKYNLSSLRILGSTGEPWNPESYMWFFENIGKKNCPIINLSGGTEVGACFLSPHPLSELKPCTLGGPALGMDIDVFDEDGKPVVGKVGELVCKKPWPGMTRGIWKDPDRYIETYWSRWKDVWLHGDWASIDGDGFWFLHGRSDDTIKIAGKRVGPAEVESAIASHPAVLESAAIGVPDELKGESIVCFICLKPDRHPTDELREQIREHATKALGKALKPKDVKFVRQIPKTRNAKILRRLIRAKYLGHKDLGDMSNLENPEALEEIARAI